MDGIKLDDVGSGPVLESMLDASSVIVEVLPMLVSVLCVCSFEAPVVIRVKLTAVTGDVYGAPDVVVFVEVISVAMDSLLDDNFEIRVDESKPEDIGN